MSLVKSKELANILGITQRRVNQLAKEGVLEKDKKNNFDLSQSVQAYIAYTTTESDELRQEKILHERAKRKKAEIELNHKEGRMHDADDVRRVMNTMLGAFRARCLAIPSKTAPRLIGQTELAIIQDIIKKEVYEALFELSNYDPTMFVGESVEN